MLSATLAETSESTSLNKPLHLQAPSKKVFGVGARLVQSYLLRRCLGNVLQQLNSSIRMIELAFGVGSVLPSKGLQHLSSASSTGVAASRVSIRHVTRHSIHLTKPKHSLSGTARTDYRVARPGVGLGSVWGGKKWQSQTGRVWEMRYYYCKAAL